MMAHCWKLLPNILAFYFQIVLATNIAETGITIPDVVFVIDTGRTKENK